MRRLAVIALLVTGTCYGQDIGMLAEQWTLLGQQGPSYLYRSTNYTWATGVSGVWSDATKWNPATVAYTGYATNDAAWITNNAADFTVAVDVAPSNFVKDFTMANLSGLTTLLVTNSLGVTNFTASTGSVVVVQGGGSLTGTAIATVSGDGMTTMRVNTNGTVAFLNEFRVSPSPSGTNYLIVDDGYFYASLYRPAYAASSGKTYLIVTNGGTHYSGTLSHLGYAGSNFEAIVTGAGSVLTNASILYQGVGPNASLTVKDGGLVSIPSELRVDRSSILVDNATMVSTLILGYTAGAPANSAIFQNGASASLRTSSGIGINSDNNLCVIRDPGTGVTNSSGTVYIGKGSSQNTLVVSNLANAVYQTFDIGAAAGASNNTLIVNGATGSCTVIHCGYGVRADNNLIIVTNGAYMALGINYYGSGTGSNHNNGVYVGSEDGKPTTAIIGYNQAYGLCLGNGSGATNNWAIFDKGAFGVGRSASQSGIMVGYAANTSNNWVLARNGAIITNCHSIQLGYAAGCRGNWATFDNATGLFVNSYLGNTGAGWNNWLLATNNSYLSLGATFAIGNAAGSSNNLATIDRSSAIATAINIGNGSGANNNGLVLTNGATLTQSGSMTLSAANSGNGCYLYMDNSRYSGTLAAGGTTSHNNYLVVSNGSTFTSASTSLNQRGTNNNLYAYGSTLSFGALSYGNANYGALGHQGLLYAKNCSILATSFGAEGKSNAIQLVDCSLNCNGSISVGNSGNTNSMNHTLYLQGGTIATGTTCNVGASVTANNSNSINIASGSTLQVNSTITVGFNSGSFDCSITNYGTIQHATVNAYTTINNPENRNGIYMMPGSCLAYTNIAVANRASLTNNWGPDRTGIYTWLGTNTFRLNNAFGTNSVAAGYTFTPTLGPTNYTRLEAIGNSGLLGQPLTVAGDGSALLSGAIFVCPFLTNSGTMTFAGTNSFAGSLLISTGSTNNTAAGVTNYVANLYTNGSLVGDGVYGSNNIPEIKGGGYLRTAWTPYRIGPTVSLWLDASDASTLTLTSSNTVSQWKDKSGYGNHAFMNAGVTQPVYNATTMNGYPGISFDGVAQKMTFSAASALSMAAVMRTEGGCGITAGVIGQDGADVGLRRTTSTPTTGFNSGGLSSDWTTTQTTNWINGVTNSLNNGEGTNTVMTIARPSTPISNTVIGRYVSSRFWKGTMTELILFDSTLAPADQQKIQGYLAWKYGLTNQLEATHPYKSAPP